MTAAMSMMLAASPRAFVVVAVAAAAATPCAEVAAAVRAPWGTAMVSGGGVDGFAAIPGSVRPDTARDTVTDEDEAATMTLLVSDADKSSSGDAAKFNLLMQIWQISAFVELKSFRPSGERSP